MPYEKFDPRGRKPAEQSFIREHKTNPFIVFLQLAGIFTLLRSVMLITGITFIRIPIMDPFLVSILRMFTK